MIYQLRVLFVINVIAAFVLLVMSRPCYAGAHQGDREREINTVISRLSGNDIALRSEDVQAYLEHFEIENLGETRDSAQARVCSFAISHFDHSSGTVLIVSLDYSLDGWCTTIVITGRSANRVWATSTTASNVEDVSSLVSQPNWPQKKYLFVPVGISDYDGANCLAVITKVLDVKDFSLIDVSSRFPVFYRSQIESRRRAALGAKTMSICEKMEWDKLERLAGIDRRAGFFDASEWANSDDTATRMKAVRVFADINDAESLKKLAALTRDRAIAVSNSAQIFLRQATNSGGP